MEREEELFLALTQTVMTGQIDTDLPWEQADWEKIFELCQNNKLVANTFEYINQLSVVPEALTNRWNQLKFMTFIRQKKCFYSLKALIEEADKQQISYALFKGEIISNLYKNPYLRVSADSDIFVDEKDREKMLAIVEAQGYEYNEKKSKGDKVSVYYNRKNDHLIEVHTSLYEDYSGEQIDILNSMNLTNAEKRVKINIDGVNFFTLGHEEHLIFQMFHVIKHFMLEGVCIRYLIDITLFINKYFNEINWKSFWEKAERLNYVPFCYNFFSLCEKYYGLNSKVLAGRSVELSEEDEEALLLDFIYKGNSNGNRNQNWQLLDDMRAYLEGSKRYIESSSWLEKKRKLLFPSQAELPNYFTYAKENKFLVPIAWIHRIFHSIHKHHVNKKQYGVLERRKAIEFRESMIEKSGLLNAQKDK